MKIAVIGAGNVGRALGRGWSSTGHEVTWGVRVPDDPKYAGLATARLPNAVEDAEVVVLAVPWSAAENSIQSAGSLEGKIVIDCTNPLRDDLGGLVVAETTSGGEMVADWASGASVFKAFNSVGSNIMEQPLVDGRRALMLVCGDDNAKMPTVIRLVEEIGFDAVDAGGIEVSRQLEQLAVLWIRLAYQQGLGREFAFAMLRR